MQLLSTLLAVSAAQPRYHFGIRQRIIISAGSVCVSVCVPTCPSCLILFFKSAETQRMCLISSGVKSFSVRKLRSFRFTAFETATVVLVKKKKEQITAHKVCNLYRSFPRQPNFITYMLVEQGLMSVRKQGGLCMPTKSLPLSSSPNLALVVTLSPTPVSFHSLFRTVTRGILSRFASYLKFLDKRKVLRLDARDFLRANMVT